MSFTQFDDAVPPGVTNLRMGSPAVKTLKKSALIMKNAAELKLAQSGVDYLFCYGPEVGAIDYRSALESFLTEHYQSPVDKDDLVETAGATYGLHLLGTTFFSTGDLIFTEDLTYFVAIEMFKRTIEFNIEAVKMDEDGIDPDALEKTIEAHSTTRQQWQPTESRPYWAMLYLIPQFQNPTGSCLNPARSERIIQLARKYNLLVVCDDVYNLLYFPDTYPDGKCPQRLFAFDKKSDSDYFGNVVSNGSFSKFFGPGIRLGWLEAPKPVIKGVLKGGVLKSGGAPNHMTAGLMATVMEQGDLTKLVHETRLENQERARTVSRILRSKVPSVHFIEPKGGYFVWLTLPDEFPMNAIDFMNKCIEDYKVAIFSGEIYSATPGSSGERSLRLTFSYYEKEELERAVGLIVECMLKVLKK